MNVSREWGGKKGEKGGESNSVGLWGWGGSSGPGVKLSLAKREVLNVRRRREDVRSRDEWEKTFRLAFHWREINVAIWRLIDLLHSLLVNELSAWWYIQYVKLVCVCSSITTIPLPFTDTHTTTTNPSTLTYTHSRWIPKQGTLPTLHQGSELFIAGPLLRVSGSTGWNDIYGAPWARVGRTEGETELRY